MNTVSLNRQFIHLIMDMQLPEYLPSLARLQFWATYGTINFFAYSVKTLRVEAKDVVLGVFLFKMLDEFIYVP